MHFRILDICIFGILAGEMNLIINTKKIGKFRNLEKYD